VHDAVTERGLVAEYGRHLLQVERAQIVRHRLRGRLDRVICSSVSAIGVMGAAALAPATVRGR
jgi:hypothetical protein